MTKSIRSHIRSNVVGYVAVFLALSGGTAYALGGSNTVFSDDIVNGEVRGSDLASNSVVSGKVANDSLTGDDVTNLSGGDLLPNSLGGLNINEASLGTVAEATQGGKGRYGYVGSCNPEAGDYTSCSTVEVPHSRSGRLLIIASLDDIETDINGGGWGAGTCQLEVNEQPIETSRAYMEFHLDEHDWLSETTSKTLIAVSDVLPAGSQWAGVACKEVDSGSDDRGMSIDQARIVGVALSDG